MTFGEKLKEARKEAGLSQEQLAQKLSVSRSAVAKWASDKGMPDVNNLKANKIMRIYVDFDDCLCETARAFSKLAQEMFNKHVPYEQIHYFELERSFDLNAEQYERFMLRGHEPEILLSYDATPGAAETINEWIACGHEVSIITGRPSSAYEPSRIWLDEHGFKNVRMYCLNKYGRDFFIKKSSSTLELEDYYRMKFDYAVEDSPKAFRFFEHLPELKVLVFDRPWNRECAFPNGNYRRCANWESIRRIVAGE